MPQPMKLGALAGVLFATFAFALFAMSRHTVAAEPLEQGFETMPHLDLKPGLWNLAVHNSQILPRTIIDTPALEKQLEKLSPEERKKAMDDLGFSRQLVFSTFSAGQYLSHPDMHVRYGGIVARPCRRVIVCVIRIVARRASGGFD